MNFRGVLKPLGLVLIGLGVVAAACAAVDLFIELAFFGLSAEVERGEATLLATGLVSVATGSLLYLYGRHHDRNQLRHRDATLAVVLIWVTSGIVGAIPFVIATGMSVPDALFESVSGLTTTGATVITNIENTLPRPLLLWRSLLQWLGGMGIVVLFVAVLPNLPGARRMMRNEVPGTTPGQLTPRIADTARILWRIYVAFTVIVAATYFLEGMSPFDCVCHALTTVSTGGFSTHDASIGHFRSPAIEVTASIYMLMASINYGLYYSALRKERLRGVLQSSELRWFAGIVAVAFIGATLGICRDRGDSLIHAARQALFMVSTTISSTGYGAGDYTSYGSLALSVMIFLMFVGGSSGSTAGGLKVERILLMKKLVGSRIRGFAAKGNVVRPMRVGRGVVDPELALGAVVLLFIYLACMLVGILLVTAIDHVPVETAFGAMLTCLSNMGPAPFHEFVGDDNFARYSAYSKSYFVIAMVLGRLEFYAVLALFVPRFWRLS